MWWTVLAVILMLWLLGFIGEIGGNLVHLLLAVALIVLILQIVPRKRTR